MQKRYVVDLRHQQAECDANYVRLTRLLHGMPEKQEWEYAVEGSHSQVAERVSLRVIESAPYTSTIEVKQVESPHQWSKATVLKVRMYHDAQMAEVVAWDKHWNTRSRYEYPNPRMYQRDEKAQFNKFLGEWLSCCLSQGRVVHTFAISEDS
ncbi:DUF1249 domain-containing protein [Marinibactrum halimedae]|uniref:DUF1249 domain-containing protein n=1 Tax=Marinibactrum halimedae TaxID=1444977 RepID=A0AA37T227_9GAMM|nr:DUF1249 domain-containing protein [Marinibactrum halimedae]MCD9457748.1 DUF1249 domain-containing protein [Marinibactrum halimedae]GLS24878.1 hypothetical protein GCM10007877_05920 [Marinibactrum halimedae]